MNIMPRAAALILFSGFLYGHCQVPCGIYDDALRIVQIREDLTTIQKAMKQITAMAADESALGQNQSVRWVQTKEDHANRIQETITSYFLIQRIKPVEKGHKDYNNYVKQTLLLHQVLVSAMKCKQTLDAAYISQIDDHLNQFVDVYFDARGKEYLRKLSP